MTSVFLTSCTDFFLIRWIAEILGFFLNIIYLVFDKVGICNIGLCIIDGQKNGEKYYEILYLEK